MHQDISPRNLVINEADDLCIFDFGYSIMIDKHYTPDHDNLKGVIFTLYEMITLDEHFREVPHKEQDAEALFQLPWVKHPDVKLDHKVQDFRDELDKWIAKRKTREFRLEDSSVQWPWMPPEPLAPSPVFGRTGEIAGTELKSIRVVFHDELMQRND
ncbi:Protein kinase-like domain [Cordyceps javanica]|uniref:Protein kinase-like domain n=1 Tax=Cordyceps javanica TaxID=43265 RepID=A0A545V915_9HYPO|nr:Protein kinase-like domain [Cordyceps javanica]TQW09438.1 Protein kinase-like domain [Cordyceps javanica]